MTLRRSMMKKNNRYKAKVYSMIRMENSSILITKDIQIFLAGDQTVGWRERVRNGLSHIFPKITVLDVTQDDLYTQITFDKRFVIVVWYGLDADENLEELGR